MFSIPELSMPKTRKITTVYSGKRVVCEDCEEAKYYFIRQMMTSDGEGYERYCAIYTNPLNSDRFIYRNLAAAGGVEDCMRRQSAKPIVACVAGVPQKSDYLSDF